MIYLDAAEPSPGGTYKGKPSKTFAAGVMYSHLTADTEEELREFARSVKLPLAWIQCPGTYRFHFDVTGGWLRKLERDPRINRIGRKDMGRLLLKRRGDAATSNGAENGEDSRDDRTRRLGRGD